MTTIISNNDNNNVDNDNNDNDDAMTMQPTKMITNSTSSANDHGAVNGYNEDENYKRQA